MPADIISPQVETLAKLLTPNVTSVPNILEVMRDPITISSRSAEAHGLGITNRGQADVTLVVASLENRIGNLALNTNNAGNCVYIDNRNSTGNFHANFRLLGSNNIVVINDIRSQYVGLHDVFLRGSEQFLFWGAGASAVGCRIEVEDSRQGVIIGDDCMISSDVWIRNHNMHSIVDLATHEQVDGGSVTTVLERHVWIGQDTLLLKCERIGKGTILGARSFLKNRLPEKVLAVGAPAKIIREGVSWGRNTSGISREELGEL